MYGKRSENEIVNNKTSPLMENLTSNKNNFKNHVSVFFFLE